VEINMERAIGETVGVLGYLVYLIIAHAIQERV
jgi:hypothetical protein